LIYEIVWLQLLQLVIGLTTISLGVLLGTFMGGMCLGSWLLPRFVSTQHHALRVYALLELAIGVVGVAVLFAMPFISQVYTANAGHGMTGMFVRGAVAAVCLLPPTFLMGATLPAISRWVEATPQGVSWLGFFYGGNIAGARVDMNVAQFNLRARFAGRASDERAQPREQFRQIERFDEIVVGAGVQAAHAILVGVARGEHEDRCGFSFAEAFEDYPAVRAREHDVQHDGVVVVVLSLVQTFVTRFGRIDGVAFFAQRLAQAAEQSGFVFNDQDSHVRVTRPWHENSLNDDRPVVHPHSAENRIKTRFRTSAGLQR